MSAIDSKNKITNFIIYGTVVFCIFSFKIKVLSVGDGNIRIDDGLILIAAITLLVRGIIAEVPISRVMRVYLLFVGVGFISAIWNSLFQRVEPLTAFVYAARLAEYLTFYYMGYNLAKTGFRLHRVLFVYLVVMCVVVPLQIAGIVPAVSAFGSGGSRAIGNTNGPYELAGFCGFTLCFMGYQRKSRWSGFMSFGLIVLSASRVALVATLVTMFRTFRRYVTLRTTTFLTCLLFLAAVIAYGASLFWGGVSSGTGDDSQIEIISRLQHSKSVNSFDELLGIWNAAGVYDTSEDYATGGFLHALPEGFNPEDSDASGMVRAFRWSALIKSTLAHADSVLIGLGPSFATSAADGYYVRVFTETGLAGVVSFFYFLISTYRQNDEVSQAFKEYLVILVLTAVFIDIFTSYKIMIAFWLWHGMEQYRGEQEDAYSLPHAG